MENNGIILNKEEYLLFNTIFSDPMLDITLKDIENYKKLIKKIVPMKKIGIKEFTYEIKLTIVNRILDLNYSKLEKLKIVNFKMKGESFISYIKSIIKIILLG